MTNKIVTVNVSQQVAPTPSLLQKTGALISFGGTNTSAGSSSLLTQLSDLTPLLNGALSLSGIVQSAGTATATATAPHGLPNGEVIPITIAGAAQANYNGTHNATVTGASTFTFAVPSGTVTPATGTLMYTVEDVTELLQMATTFFGQGSAQSVYVLELGVQDVTDAVAFLTSWITANPNVYYSYLVPRTWDANTAFLNLLASFESTTAKTYFFVTTTLATYANYTALMKCVHATIEAPAYAAWGANVLTALSESGTTVTATTTSAHGIAVGQWFQISGCTPAGYNGWKQAQQGTTGSTIVWNDVASIGAESVLGTLVASYYSSTGVASSEFSAAAAFYVTLNYAPSSINLVTPLSFAFLSGVTPFPVKGNSALLTTLKTAFINIVGTGAEGGISNALELWGTMMDGNPFNYWYATDWAQINLDLAISNAIINGSNNPTNPLYYNQAGINTLQKVAQNVLNSGVAFGLLLGPVYVAAVPLNTYVAANPGDFKIGAYNGLSATVTPNRGFISITFNLVVTNFIAP